MDGKVFADGTPASGDPDQQFYRVSASDWKRFAESHKPITHGRKIHHNPPAADIHKKESGAPWRLKGDALVAADRRKAEVCCLSESQVWSFAHVSPTLSPRSGRRELHN